MAKGDAFWRNAAGREAMRDAEVKGQVVDSMDVRKALIARMHAGEMTLEEVQAELKRIKRGAKKAGLVTREQAFRDGKRSYRP